DLKVSPTNLPILSSPPSKKVPNVIVNEPSLNDSKLIISDKSLNNNNKNENYDDVINNEEKKLETNNDLLVNEKKESKNDRKEEKGIEIFNSKLGDEKLESSDRDRILFNPILSVDNPLCDPAPLIIHKPIQMNYAEKVKSYQEYFDRASAQ